MIIVIFVIRKNVYTSEPFFRYLLPILDSSKYFANYISQVALEDCPSLVYYNNDIKEAQTVGMFSVLQLISLTIVHATIFLADDTRREIDITIAAAVFQIGPRQYVQDRIIDLKERNTSCDAFDEILSKGKKIKEGQFEQL